MFPGIELYRVWDSETHKCVSVLEGHTDEVWGVAISGDGKRATSGSKDRTVHTSDLETGKCVAIFEGHTDEVWGVAISRNGRYAISGSRDQTVRLSNIETGMWVAIYHPILGYNNKRGN